LKLGRWVCFAVALVLLVAAAAVSLKRHQPAGDSARIR
jgi:hypothetical protein